MSFACFFFNIEKSHRQTFYSILKGKESTLKRIKQARSDGVKALVTFSTSRHHWKSIEGEIREFVAVNWDRWESEKPQWFDDAMRGRIPISYVPKRIRKSESDRREREFTEKVKNTGKVVPDE